MKQILIIFIVFISHYAFAGFEDNDPVAKKFKGKMVYAQRQFYSEIKKIKYGMARDYKKLMNIKMTEGDLEAANEIKKKLDYLKGDSQDPSVIDLDLDIPETILDTIFLTGKSINVAAAKNGGTVISCQKDPGNLIDGNTTEYTGGTGFGSGIIPCKFEFEFKTRQNISYIQFLLWDGDSRFYRYTVETSGDGSKWDLLVDCSKKSCRSWQQFSFKPRKIKYVRINGLFNSVNSGFHIVEFEAYPRKPKKVPKPKS